MPEENNYYPSLYISCPTGDWSPTFVTGDADCKTEISIFFNFAKGLSSPIQDTSLVWPEAKGISLCFYVLTR